MNYSHVELLQAPGILKIGAVYDPAENRRFARPLTMREIPADDGRAVERERSTNFDPAHAAAGRRLNRFVQVGGFAPVSVPAGNVQRDHDAHADVGERERPVPLADAMQLHDVVGGGRARRCA